MIAPHAHRFGMGVQAFDLGERCDHRRDLPQARPGQLLYGNQFYEIENAQPAAKAGGSASWQNMIRSRCVVARGLRRVVAHEDRTRVANKRKVWRVDRNMLGSEVVLLVP